MTKHKKHRHRYDMCRWLTNNWFTEHEHDDDVCEVKYCRCGQVKP